MTQVRERCEAEMEKAYPNNHTMSYSIARNLQELRDDGVIVFVEGKRGTYRWSKIPYDSDEDMESWPNVDEGYEGDKEAGGISKEMMWKMCQEQYKMIKTLKEANGSLTKEVDELKKKDIERLLMVAKARQVAQKALDSSSPSDVDEDDGLPLESTWSNEAVIESPPPRPRCRGRKKIEFDEVVKKKVYEIDGTMRPHKRWKKEPVVKMSPNMGHW